MTKEEMSELVYDPAIMQKNILDKIESASDGSVMVSDPTNPFAMLLEAAAYGSSNASIEAKNVMRKKYPTLSRTPEELYHHLTDNELSNMFSIPAEGIFIFHINGVDFRDNGFRPEGADYVETTIPINTEITVADTTFTLLNNIVIKMFDNGSVFAEQQYNKDDMAVNDLGILGSGMVTDSEGVPWVIVETRIKQVKKHYTKESVTSGVSFRKDIPIEEKYCYSIVEYKGGQDATTFLPLNKTHTDEFIDDSLPTVVIADLNTKVRYSIPDVYILNNEVSGEVKISTYTTKGSIYLPIKNYNITDFSVTLGDTTINPSASTIQNIAVIADSRNVVDGGKNKMSLEEMRNSIIFNSTGDIDEPITDYHIKRLGTFDGFELFKALDTVTERIFLASKNLPEISTDLVLSKQDAFFNTARVHLTELDTHSKINIGDEHFIIKSGTILKDDNGIINIVQDDEKELIDSLDNMAKITYFKDKKYFFTPYYYVIDRDDNNTQCRVYDLDRPVMDNIRILGKNINLDQSVNTNLFTITKTNNGYSIYLELIANDVFEEIDKSKVKVQLKLPLKGKTTYVNFIGNYDPNTGYYRIDIDTDLYITEDGYLNITNGISNLQTKEVDLSSSGYIHIFTEDSVVEDRTKYAIDEIGKEDKTGIAVFSKESIDVEFGKQIDYIWNKVYNTYTNRRYKTYTQDIPLTYDKDYFEGYDELDNSPIRCKEDGSIEYNKVHSKGDIVRDDNGDVVYKHKNGEVMLDEKGKPVIDDIGGIVRYIDMFMLEYEFLLASSQPYLNYLNLTLDELNLWLFTNLPKLNDRMVENTKLVYKSYKTSKPVTIELNKIKHKIPYVTKPEVTLYTSRDSYTATEIEDIERRVGKVLHRHFDKTSIKMSEIKEDIINDIGNGLEGVKITNVDTMGDVEAFNITDKTTRLLLDKKLDVNKNNELIVKYDITVNIQTI